MRRLARSLAATLVPVALVALAAAPARSQPSARPTATRSWSLHTSASSVFDSNLGHQREAESAYGLIVAAGVGWRNDLRDPSLEIEYEAALHSYSGDTQWDRVSHHLGASWEVDISDRWKFELVGEGSRRGSSDDRELADVLALEPRIAVEPTQSTRLRLAAAYRQKWFEDDPERNAVNPYLELEVRQELPGGWEIEGGPRYEVRDASADENNFRRWTHGVALRGPIERRETLKLEVKYRDRRYTHKLVDVEAEDGQDFEVLRRDRPWWIASVSWSRSLFTGFEIEVGYKFESRSSNDPDRAFDAHQVTFGTRATL